MKKPRSKTNLIALSISTPDGEFVALYSENGLAGLNFPRNGSADLPVGLDAQQRVPARVSQWHRITTRALRDALRGCEPESLPPLDLSAGTEFQQSIWNAMRRIRTGDTLSYGDIAGIVGKPKALRAVGGACGANPIPVLVPCHRVLAANKKIGGFSGGLHWKRTLLAREGVALL